MDDEGSVLWRSGRRNRASEQREDYLKSHQKATYNRLSFEGKLNSYLYDINDQAQEMFDDLIVKYKKTEGITEELKATNQMEWVHQMNNIRERVTEIVNNELIYR